MTRNKVKVGSFFLSSSNSVSPFAYSVRFSEEKFCNKRTQKKKYEC